MAHSHHMHREHQVSHRRVNKILEEAPSEAKKHAHSHAFSKVTSKSAAEHHDAKVHGHKGAKRFARGGHVKAKGHGGTNIAVIVPQHHPAASPPPAAGPTGGAPGAGAPPALPPAAMAAMMGGAGGPPGGGGGMPMPAMHKRGGKVIDGEATPANIKKLSKRASDNSYARGGALSGVGREEKAEHMSRKKGRM